MRRLLATVVVLVLALAVAAVAAARDPRLEQVRLTKAGIAQAKQVVLRRSDLGPGWSAARLPPESECMSCPGFNPDLSRFTIVGKARSAFVRRTGSSIVSAVEVYKSVADAEGDFRAAARPEVARCLRAVLETQFITAPVLANVLSSRVVPAPRVGDRRIAYRVVARLDNGLRTVNVYVDVLVVQRGRTIAAVFFTGAPKRVAGQARVAAAIASRMR